MKELLIYPQAFASERARIEHEHESKTSMRAAGDLYDLFNDEDETIDISKYAIMSLLYLFMC